VKLSAQEEYGLRCLLQLARREGQSLTLPELAQLEGISVAHAAKVLRALRRGGFVHSTRGQAGGYTIARPAHEITIAEALAALGGRFFDAQFCERHAGLSTACTHLGECSIRPVLRQLQDVFDDVLGRLSLKSLLVRERELGTRRAVPLTVLPH
jgi:Rrf2 family protein